MSVANQTDLDTADGVLALEAPAHPWGIEDSTVADEPAAQPVNITPGRSTSDILVIGGLSLVLWIGLVCLGRVWGMLLERQGHDLVLFTPPLLGAYREVLTPALALPVPVAVIAVLVLPRLARTVRWGAVLITGVVSNLVWGVVLTVVDGNSGLIAGLEWDAEYGPAVEQMRTIGLGTWLSRFIESVATAGIQIRAHPPGMPLLLSLLDRLGMSGPWWAAVVILAAAASSVVAVLVAVREVCDEDTARRAMPFVALAPAVLFVFTSYDALYMAASAWFVTALILAARRTGACSVRWAVGAGLFAVAAILGTYGAVLIGLVPLAVVIRDRAWKPVLIATATALSCVLAFVPFGFWWLTGLEATRTAYYALNLDRPHSYFLLNTFSALALVVGPAVAPGLALNRDRRLWMVVGGAVGAIVVANLSGLSTGEVERIWLPFAIWLLPVGAVLAGRARSASGWLVLQAACPIVLTCLIRTYW